jgi:hypothetical protein
MLLASLLAWEEPGGPNESVQLLIATSLFGLQIIGWMIHLFVAPSDSEVPFTAEVSIAEMIFCFGIASAGLILLLIFGQDRRTSGLEWAVLGMYGSLLQVVWVFGLLGLFGYCMHRVDRNRSKSPERNI